MVDAVHDQQRDERHERQRANLLRAAPDRGHRREHFVDGQFGAQRFLVRARRCPGGNDGRGRRPVRR